MDATIARRPFPGVAALLSVVAVIGIAASAMAGTGTHAQAVIGAAAAGLAALVAGLVIRSTARDEDAWPSAPGISWALLLISVICLAFAVVGSTSRTSIHPRPTDTLLLLLLIPFTVAI